MKTLFTAINLLFVVAAAYALVDLAYKKVTPETTVSSDGPVTFQVKQPESGQENGKKILDKNLADAIVKRNLFQVDIKEKNVQPEVKKEEKPVEELQPTKLNLTLWGTVTGEQIVYAVIEDKKIRKQALYQVGDQIQGAEIKKILRHQVVLRYNGKDELLEIVSDTGKTKGGRRFTKPTPQRRVTEPAFNADVGNLPDNLSEIMRQIKFRPHFSSGEPDGVMVYGIRPNSLFRKIGLRNGDIIKDVNGGIITTTDDLSDLLTDISGEDDISISLMRRGKTKELVYNPFPEESAADNTIENDGQESSGSKSDNSIKSNNPTRDVDEQDIADETKGELK